MLKIKATSLSQRQRRNPWNLGTAVFLQKNWHSYHHLSKFSQSFCKNVAGKFSLVMQINKELSGKFSTRELLSCHKFQSAQGEFHDSDVCLVTLASDTKYSRQLMTNENFTNSVEAARKLPWRGWSDREARMENRLAFWQLAHQARRTRCSQNVSNKRPSTVLSTSPENLHTPFVLPIPNGFRSPEILSKN